MRRTDKLMSEAEAWALLGRAPVIHLATTTPAGEPLLRTLHAVVHQGHLCFHGARQGEKNLALGRPAVASAEEVLARLPSWFSDPERACPATTLFRSAMVHGQLEEVEDLELRAEILQALMERLQPEGGHVPISAQAPLYRGALQGIRVLRLRTGHIAGKASLGQAWKPAQRASVMAGLWTRGDPGDLEALQLLAAPDPPDWLRGLEATRLLPAPGEARVEGAIALLHEQYWNQGVEPARIATAHRHSPCWVAAVDPQGTVVGTARAIADGAKLAYVMDVAIHPAWRGRGLGRALLRLLLDHPQLRGCRRVELHTRDAGPFYAGIGFGPMVDPAWREGWRLQR